MLLEVPLHELAGQSRRAGHRCDVHCSLVALVKDAGGEVVQKISRDRSLSRHAGTVAGWEISSDKMTVPLPPESTLLESAVMDRESGKTGTQRTAVRRTAPTPGGGHLVPRR